MKEGLTRNIGDTREAATTGLKIAAPGLLVLLAGAIVWLNTSSIVTGDDGRPL